MDDTKWLPEPPRITRADVWRQISLDAHGKEVASAATYSYTWLADQVGHMGLGILLAFGTIALAGLLPGVFGANAMLAGVLVAVAMVCAWEWRSYQACVRQAAGSQFPLRIKLLRRNALVAAFYMSLGVGMGWALHLDGWWPLPLILAMIAAAFAVAIPWVRQKMIWQKAALPYLGRMADLPRIMPDDVAHALWSLVTAAPPSGRDGVPRHVVAAGAVGSGRTRLASAIGTEHAFMARTVRYIALSELADSATVLDYGEGEGPANIGYWAWSRAQVLIVDDIGPFLAASANPGETPEQALERLLGALLGPIRAALAMRSTVWLLGESASELGPRLDDMAQAIGEFLHGAAPLAIQLIDPPRPLLPITPARPRPSAPAPAPAA